MKFRPCIDIHNGKVKQLVGGSLKDKGNQADENFVSEKDAAYYANLYKKDGIKGGHIIILNAGGSEFFKESKKQALAALKAYPNGMQIGGGDIRVKTIDGDVKFNIKPGTQTGTRIRLKGKGVCHVRNNSMRGDQYSTLVVKVPTKLTSEQKELIKKFDAVSGNTLNEFGEDKHETAEDKIKKFFKK